MSRREIVCQLTVALLKKSAALCVPPLTCLFPDLVSKEQQAAALLEHLDAHLRDSKRPALVAFREAANAKTKVAAGGSGGAGGLVRRFSSGRGGAKKHLGPLEFLDFLERLGITGVTRDASEVGPRWVRGGTFSQRSGFGRRERAYLN